MRNNVTEVLDLALTQAIERYAEMEPYDIQEAIATEWPEQLAVVLVEYMLKTTCGNCTGIPDFIQIERDTGDGHYYLVPLCSCDLKLPPVDSDF